MSSKSLQIKIGTYLKKIGTSSCFAEANKIESLSTFERRFHFRNLNLSIFDLEELLDILNQDKENNINSVSFSYNLIGDEGALIFAKRVPNYIEEIGLVRCGLGDLGGRAILKLLHELPNLEMICIEQNNLSENLKLEFHKFGAFHPRLMINF